MVKPSRNSVSIFESRTRSDGGISVDLQIFLMSGMNSVVKVGQKAIRVKETVNLSSHNLDRRNLVWLEQS